jgi:hypothetical protein
VEFDFSNWSDHVCMDGMSWNLFSADTFSIHAIYWVLFSDGLKDTHFLEFFPATGRLVLFLFL